MATPGFDLNAVPEEARKILAENKDEDSVKLVTMVAHLLQYGPLIQEEIGKATNYKQQHFESAGIIGRGGKAKLIYCVPSKTARLLIKTYFDDKDCKQTPNDCLRKAIEKRVNTDTAIPILNMMAILSPFLFMKSAVNSRAKWYHLLRKVFIDKFSDGKGGRYGEIVERAEALRQGRAAKPKEEKKEKKVRPVKVAKEKKEKKESKRKRKSEEPVAEKEKKIKIGNGGEGDGTDELVLHGVTLGYQPPTEHVDLSQPIPEPTPAGSEGLVMAGGSQAPIGASAEAVGQYVIIDGERRQMFFE